MINTNAQILTNILENHIRPKVGVDIPYLKKYLTYNDAFHGIVKGDISGSRDATYDYRINTGTQNYTMYDGLGYHLVGTDGTDYGEIEKIFRHPETFESYIEVADDVVLPSGINDYHITKHYDSVITEAPQFSQDTDITGALAVDTEISLNVNNNAGNDYVEGVGDVSSTDRHVIEDFSLSYDKSDIGSKIIIDDSPAASPAGYRLEAIIEDVYEGNMIKIDREVSSSITSNVGLTTVRKRHWNACLKDLSDYVGKAVTIRIYINDAEMPYETGSSVLWTGKIYNITDITNDEVNILLRGRQAYKGQGSIGELISYSDSYVSPNTPQDAIGKMKPIVFGDNRYSNLGSLGEPVYPDRKLVKCVYLGMQYSGGSIYAYYLVAGHDVSIDNLYIKNNGGRYNHLISSWTTETVGNDTLVKISLSTVGYKRAMSFRDYYYPNGNADIVLGAGMQNINQAADANASTEATTSVTNEPEGVNGGKYEVDFNEYDLPVDDSDILNVTVRARAKATSFNDPSPPSENAYFRINGIDIAQWNSSYFLDYYDYALSSFDKSVIKESVEVDTYAGDYIGIVREYVSYVALMLKVIDYRTENFEELDMYASCQGKTYGTWINNRYATGVNPNGGAFCYTHDDNNGAGDVIKNAVGIIEALMRDDNNGCGLENADIELDAFNKASTKIETGENAIVLLEQAEFGSVIEKLCFENNLVVDENEVGRVTIDCYDKFAPMTYNVMDFDGTDDEVSIQEKTVAVGDTLVIIMKPWYQQNAKPILGNSTYLGAPALRTDGDYLRLYTGSTGSYAEWTVTELRDRKWHIYELKSLGSNGWKLYVDGNDRGARTAPTSTYSFSYIGRVADSFFEGQIKFISVKNDNEDKFCLYALDRKYCGLGTDGGRGTGYTSFADDYMGICVDRAIQKQHGYTPIIEGSFRLNNEVSDIYTHLTQYFTPDIDNKYLDDDVQSDYSSIDEKIAKTHYLDYAKENVDLRGTTLLYIHANKNVVCEFEITASGMLFTKFDVIRIISRELDEAYDNIDTMTWMIIGIDKSLDGLTARIRAVLLNE